MSKKIYTRTGDKGETSLFGGARISKSASRVEAYGELDELNASLGVARASAAHPDNQKVLEELQRDLFRLGALVANPEGKPTPEMVSLEDTDVLRLEQHIDGLESRLGKLTRFIIPGGTPSSALLHQARAICRRAERRLVALAKDEPVPSHATAYLNRMSDLLFVMARLENHNQNVEDTVW